MKRWVWLDGWIHEELVVQCSGVVSMEIVGVAYMLSVYM